MAGAGARSKKLGKGDIDGRGRITAPPSRARCDATAPWPEQANAAHAVGDEVLKPKHLRHAFHFFPVGCGDRVSSES
jgi:hypothetical protein